MTVTGAWPDVWRANLVLRGAGRVLIRLASFPVVHLSQLDKRARRIPWGAYLTGTVPVRVEAACKRSRIYHSGAAAQRVAKAIEDGAGARIAAEAPLRVLVRIERNLCTVSLDTSGDLLHKRGYKQAVNKAPLRETLAALCLRACRFTGDEPVIDPMCGSGTIVIEAAGMAMGQAPGRLRDFAFQHLAGFDPAVWQALKSRADAALGETALRFHGADRDAGAVAMSQANAERAGVGAITRFDAQAVSRLTRPDGTPGLVLVNPPYGDRLGDAEALRALYAGFGQTVRERLSGWRVGIIARDAALVGATGLECAEQSPPFPHGALRVRLYRTGPLP